MGIAYTQTELREWGEFVQGLRERNRYMPTNKAYFAKLLEGCLKRRQLLSSGTSLFRSRIMPLEQSLANEPFRPEDMGPPPSHVATAGRLNPEGISCLYAALEEDTAVAEVRPWTGARLTVAEFKTLDPLELLDLTPGLVVPSGSSELRQHFLSLIITRPIHREDRWGYLGTQYLAEALKAKGVVGILYESSLRARGRNVAIFSTLTLNAERTKLVDIYAVSHSYGPPAVLSR
jgi:RES domain-containing protein